MNPNYKLVVVETEFHWKEYHRIRREELFDNSPTYQEDHEDGFKPKTHPCLCTWTIHQWLQLDWIKQRKHL